MKYEPDWPEVTLSEVSADVTVGFVGSMSNEYQESGITFLRSKNVKPYSIDLEDIRFISTSFHKRISKSSLRPGDVVIVRTGTPGITAVIPDWLENANCADLVIVRPGPKLNSRFLTYYMNSSAIHQIDSQIVGAVQQHFNVTSAKMLRFYLPPITQQERIVEILGSLDDKIELNRQMNLTLEQMAQALFKSWFVDFDPVVAKAAGNNPYGMSDEIAALFPERFTDSELGPIPEGWRVDAVGSVLKTVGGGTPSTRERSYWEGGTIHWATPRDLSTLKDPILSDTERRITKKGLSKISSGLLPKNTVLLSSRAPIGYIAIADIPLAVNQGFIAILPNNHASPYFVKHWLEENANEIISRANGTTFLEISKRNFRPILLCFPPKTIMTFFHEDADHYYQLIKNNIHETRTLEKLRDALLPKLISGQIRIKQAEEIVSEAV